MLALAMVVIIVRATRLLVVDEWPPVAALRAWFVRTFATVDRLGTVVRDRKRWGRLAGLGYSIAYVWTCPWCMSIWAGAAVWGVGVWWPWIIWPSAVVALGSLLAGWDSNLQGEHDQRWKLADRKLLGRDDMGGSDT